MISVKETIKNMCNRHLEQVRTTLAKDKAFNKFTLAIFDSYLKGQNEDQIFNDLSLSESSFKVFERVIEREIYNFYGIEDTSIRDLIFSSIFYAVYGNNQKAVAEKSLELEGLFHSLKQFNLDQESYLITNKLYQLNINTPLESVYKHLSKKYYTIAQQNQICNGYLVDFNLVLTRIVDGNKKTSDVKNIISLYKKIRTLYLENENNTCRAIYHLCKFICVTIVGQKQLLKDGSHNADDLLIALSKDIDSLPFGIERFYMNNIYVHVYSKYLISQGKHLLATHLINKQNDCQLYESFNFNFPNNISKENTTREHSLEINLNPIKSKAQIIAFKNPNDNYTSLSLSNRDYFPNTILN